MRLRFEVLLAATALTVAAPVAAQQPLVPDPGEANNRAGARGAAFLMLGVDARAAALGGTVAADVRGVPALYWNTAGIAHTESGRLGVSMNELYGEFDVTLGHVGAILPMGEGALGLSLTFLSSGDMTRTNTLYPQGGDPLQGEEFSYRGTAASLHYARLISDRLSLGGAIRYAQEGIDGASANFVGLDVGTQFNTGLWGTTIGASLTNIGTEGRFRGTALRARSSQNPRGSAIDVEPLADDVAMPTMFRFTAATDLIGPATSIVQPNPDHGLKLLGDVADGVSTPITAGLAAEYAYRDLAFLRVGKRFHNEPDEAGFGGGHGFGVGGGVQVPVGGTRLMLDYAYQPWGDLDNVQVFTFEIAF